MENYDHLIKEGKAKRYYSFPTRMIAHGLKRSNNLAIYIATQRMLTQIKHLDILVPMPGHTGLPVSTLKLAMNVAMMANIYDSKQVGVFRQICGNARESMYALKQRGGDPAEMSFGFDRPGMYSTLCMLRRKYTGTVWIVDNVIDTGTTMNAMLQVIPGAKPLVYAVNDKH